MLNPNSVLLTRRSVRVFNDKQIEQEKLSTIIRTAMYSPSAGNQRAWEFIISQNREHFIKMLESCKFFAPLNTAHTVILVCYDLDALHYKVPAIGSADCAAVSLQIMLAAKEHDICSVWMAVQSDPVRETKAREVFNLPDNIIPFSLIGLGYSDNPIPVPTDRFDEKKIHMETFSKK